MANYIRRWLLQPVLVPIGVAIVAAILIVGIGEALLNLYRSGQPELLRHELWFGLGLALLVLAVCAFLATRPAGATGPLEKDIVIGSRSIFAPEPPPPAVALRRGPLGTVADIQPGYTLYARSGALAKVIGQISGTDEEGGRRFSGFLYAQGLYGASDELWVPYEAVMAVYPETQSAFLAIKGDETEHFGWNKPPANVTRGERRPPAGYGL